MGGAAKRRVRQRGGDQKGVEEIMPASRALGKTGENPARSIGQKKNWRRKFGNFMSCRKNVKNGGEGTGPEHPCKTKIAIWGRGTMTKGLP